MNVESDQQESVEIQLHRKRRELLNDLRGFAWNRDEDGFRVYLTERLHVLPSTQTYSRAMREFWNAVREYEKQRCRR